MSTAMIKEAERLDKLGQYEKSDALLRKAQTELQQNETMQRAWQFASNHPTIQQYQREIQQYSKDPTQQPRVEQLKSYIKQYLDQVYSIMAAQMPQTPPIIDQSQYAKQQLPAKYDQYGREISQQYQQFNPSYQMNPQEFQNRQYWENEWNANRGKNAYDPRYFQNLKSHPYDPNSIKEFGGVNPWQRNIVPNSKDLMSYDDSPAADYSMAPSRQTQTLYQPPQVRRSS